jgi:hypothetical protein
MKSRVAGLVSAAALALAGGALGFTQVASAGIAPIGAAPLTIVKTVTGTAPAGTTFTATIQCDAAIIVEGEESTDVATVTFDATGQPTTADTVFFSGPGGCVVTETATGNATSTTYSCTEVIPQEPAVEPGSEFNAQQVPPEEGVCEAPGPQAGPMGVGIVFEDQEATVTIANTFVESAPAEQIVARPAFTG